jgi:hypothetical protein
MGSFWQKTMGAKQILIDFLKRRKKKKKVRSKNIQQEFAYSSKPVTSFFAFKGKDISSINKGQWVMHKGFIYVSCFDCGDVSVIPHKTHGVTKEGDVKPSLICSECRWHVFAYLVGWSTYIGAQDELQVEEI